MTEKTFREYLVESKLPRLPKLHDKICDVEGNEIGKVQKIQKNLITLSTGDEINTDSFYKENGKWIAEL